MATEKKFHKQTTLPSLGDPEEADPPIPARVGPYKIETLLAKGGMSLLYLGLEEKTREALAVKVLSPEYMNHPEMVDHFLWEAKIISLTNHPNIVKLRDYGRWEGGLYIAMEMIQGISLCQFLMQQSFSLKRTIDIILQVSYALLHLHTHGVIHRDLKPENILITEDGEVKVIDFGIAQLHEDEKGPALTSQLMGTPSYMAPEQKENPKNISFASDIFALGVITYELILGKISYGIINPSLLPEGMQPIVNKALAVSPSERYQDIVAFITDLTDYYKSPAIEKERSGGDQILEMLETLQIASQSLSKWEKPNWPAFEIGIAKDLSSDQLPVYLDFFRFANNTSAIIIAAPKSPNLKSTLHLAILRGMIKKTVEPLLRDASMWFDPLAFITSLNQLVCDDQIEESFHLSLLKLIPINDALFYVSCGDMGPLFHTPQGHNLTNSIENENPLIGASETSTFTCTEDSLGDGDLIVFHSLPNGNLTPTLQKTVAENVLLSPNRLGGKLLSLSSGPSSVHPKVAIALRRL